MAPCNNMSRRELLAITGIGLGATVLPFGRILAQDASNTIPAYVPPKVSAPLPDPVREGPTVYDPTPLDYVVEDRTMSGVAAIYKPTSEADFTPPPAPAGVEPNAMGGASGPGAPAGAPNIPVYDASDFSPLPILSTAPYTTRLIIYRPRDMRRFSGNVLIEFIHPTNGGQTAMWEATNRFLAFRGDAYVGVQHPRALAWLKYHKPGRYDALHSPDFSQLWGMVTDAARLLKAGGSESPLSAKATRCFLTGYSFTGLCTTTFAKRHHNVNRLDGGAPVFDGYPIGTGFGPMPPLDVPIMIGANQYAIYNDTDENLPGVTQPSAASRPVREGFDADGPMTRRRRYEMAGYEHVPFPDTDAGSAIPPTGNGGGWECEYQAPGGARRNVNTMARPMYEGMMNNIVEWISKGIAPPHAPLIETRGGKPVLDEFGNVRGGLRMPELTVPIATYSTGVKECTNTGWMVPFSPARLRQLYGDWATYLSRYSAAVDKLLADRFIVPYRADMMKLAAARSVPDF